MTLNRYAIWGANAGLFVLCCFLLAGVLAEVAAARLAPPPAEALPAAAERAAPGTPHPDRQAILDRNLFRSSLDEGEAEPAPELMDEELEETQLPLALLGTAASPDADLSWAAIDDLEERKHKVVTAGSAVKPGVEVVRIERARVVLRNGGKLEELVLADDAPPGPRTARRRPAPAPTRTAAPRERAGSLADRVRQVAESRFEVDREDVMETVRNPAALFSEARILPRYEDGQMMGIQLNAIKQGSLFEEVGLADGDTIVEFNGQSLASPADSAAFLQQLMDGSNFEVLVQDPDGGERTLTFEAN